MVEKQNIKRLRNDNNRREKQLNEKSVATYDDMIVYLRGANLSDVDVERVRSDLIEILLDAQMGKRELEDVLGTDIKNVCDEIIASLPQKTVQERWFDQFEIILYQWVILLTIGIISHALKDIMTNHRLTNLKWTVGELLAVAFIIFFSDRLVKRISKNTFKNKQYQMKNILKEASIYGSIMLCILIPIIFLNQVLLTMPYWAAFVILAIVLIVIYVLRKGIAKSNNFNDEH
ncbi:hypothetical protein [Atopobacter phocae]|uniref:hypothetical protein n=1 Tax=Atopobacter phocae TaxID=136492 RepID=UPI00046F2618|nr:hypothetical protein [Atopobacter phocae]